MKKIIITILSVCLLLLCLGAITSCNEAETIAPANLRIDFDTLTLKWSKVPRARAYEVQISGDDKVKTSLVNNYALENLKPGDYTVSVRAINVNPELSPSEWVSIPFTREPESGLRYKLINNKTAYELTGVGTASGDIVIDATYRNKPVVSIASRAFYNNKSVTSVVIGENVTSIGDMAFQKCEMLTSVKFLGDVSSIGSYAFQSCKALTSITLPNALTAIKPYTFSWCDNLTKITMGNNVELIDEYAFSNCALLSDIQFSDKLSTIGQYAFSDCKALKSVKLSSVKEIAYVAFVGCVELENLDLGTGLEKIGQTAFLNCSKLTKVVIPDTVTDIGVQAFALCSSLNEVVMGGSVRYIGEQAFYGTELYNQATDILYIGNWAIVAKNRDLISLSVSQGTALKDGTIGIADGAFAALPNLQQVELHGVKYIGKSAFAECPKLVMLWCDSALLAIDQAAFFACPSLFQVNVANSSLQTIGDNAFQACELLVDIDLPNTVKEIGAYAFRNTNAHKLAKDVVYIDNWAVDYVEKTYFDHIILRNNTVGIANYCFYKISHMGGGFKLYDKVKYIGKGAFYGCDMSSPIDITSATSIEVISDYAFYGCSAAWFGNLGITTLPDTLQYIGRSAFYNCSMMVGLKIPGSCKTIGDYAFYGCSNLGDSGEVFESIEAMKEGISLKGDVILGYGIQSIGNRAFQGCSAIIQISVPGSVTSMGERVFYKCDKLETAILSDGFLEIPAYTFYKCTSLKNVHFSDSIKKIGEGAFKGCTTIDKLMIGSEVEEIAKYAFYGCSSVNEIKLPKGIKTIGDYAFKGCGQVLSVLLYDDIETIGKHAFYGLNKATFFCVSEKINPYWHERWNSSYRPVFWGCELSEDNSYVVSFTKESEVTLLNSDAVEASFTPERADLYFHGWTSVKDSNVVEYAPKDVANAPDGTLLYSVWSTEPLPEPEPEPNPEEGDNSGNTEGGTQGGTEGGTQGGTEGGTQGGTEGGTQGGTEGGTQGGTEGGTQGGTEGGTQGGTLVLG